MENLIKRSIDAVISANDKATKLIMADLVPPREQDVLQECLLGMLTETMPEQLLDSFINDLYVEVKSSDYIYEKYFSSLEITNKVAL